MWRVVVAAVILAPLASAEGCAQGTPCAVSIDVDETGFTGADTWNATEGDWLVLAVTVWDDLPHTVAIPGAGQRFEAYPWDSAAADDAGQTTGSAFTLPAGEHLVVDETTGTQMVIVVQAAAPTEPAVALGPEAVPPGADVPWPGAFLVVALAIAMRTRR